MQSYCMLSLVEIDPVEWLQQQTLDKFWSGKLNLAFSSDEFNLKAFHLKMTILHGIAASINHQLYNSGFHGISFLIYTGYFF